MKQKMTLKEIQNCQLDILKYIDHICKKYNIEYFVNYGTLLGAIRHNGFIPWDDDIDICMYRDEYNKFITAMENEKNDKYSILSKDTSKWYFQNFLVVIDKDTVIEDHIKYKRHDTNVFVDVFPIDKFNDLNFVKKAHLMVTLRQICYIKKEYIQYGDSKLKDFLRLIVWYLLRCVNPRFFTKRIDRLIKKYSDDNGMYEGAIGVSKDKFKEVFKSGTLKELTEHKFEDIIVPIPKNYEVFLTQLYGDYMKIPSEEEIANKSHQLNSYKIK